MLKLVNVLTIALFVLVTSVMPYATAQGASLALTQTPEERDIFSTQVYEEEIHHEESSHFFIKTIVTDLCFPHYIALGPQTVLVEILKPPLA